MLGSGAEAVVITSLRSLGPMRPDRSLDLRRRGHLAMLMGFKSFPFKP